MTDAHEARGRPRGDVVPRESRIVYVRDGIPITAAASAGGGIPWPTGRLAVRSVAHHVRFEASVALSYSSRLTSRARQRPPPPPPSLWPSLSSWNDDVIVAQDGWLLCRLAQALRRTPTPNAYHPFDRPLVVVVERRLHRRATCMVGCRVASHRHCAERQCLPPTSASDSCHRAPRHS